MAGFALSPEVYHYTPTLLRIVTDRMAIAPYKSWGELIA